MSYNPDPIFRDGLENYRKSAPASAWERVEAGLDRKRRKGVWLRIAAGLCLLIAASTVLWQYDQADTVETEVAVGSQQSAVGSRQSAVGSQQMAVDSQQLAVGSLQSPNSNPIVERSRNNHSDVVHEDLPVVERSRNDNLKSSRLSGVSRESSVVSREVVDAPHETQQNSVVKTDDLLETPASGIQIENSMEESVNDVAAAQKSIIISYSSEEVNEKFLKKESTSEATPAKKNTSGLQKVIEKALDLTNEGTVYGELREKKNEWLSFNMLSNKTEANK